MMMGQNKISDTPEEDGRNIKSLFTLITGILFLTLSLMIVLHPYLRYQIHQQFHPDFRKVLSTIHMELNNMSLVILKIKTRTHIKIEVYNLNKQEGVQNYIETLTLPDKRNGYFHFNGQATSMAVDDINQNGKFDLIVPSFDEDLIAHLNIFEFNEQTQHFEPISL